MAIVNSANIKNPSAEPFVSNVQKRFLEVFEPNLFFKEFAEAPVSQVGYKSVTWIKPDRYTVSPSQALLTPGVTPVDTPLKLNTIEATAKQYGLYTVLSDEVALVGSGYNLSTVTGELVGKNMARIIDAVIQDVVMQGTNVTYASTTSGGTRASGRSSLGATNKIFAYDLAYISKKMQARYAPYYDGQSYVAILHPSVSLGLMQETGTGGWIDISKYSRPDKLYNGEIGKLYNVRIVESAYVQTFASTVTVYPTLVIGKQAYGIAELSAMETVVHSFGSSGTADPLNQRMTIGAKTFFTAKILQEDSLERFESAGIF